MTTNTYTVERDGVAETYVIERDYETVGYSTSTVVWNQDGTPRSRRGWQWYRLNGNSDNARWGTTKANCIRQINGEETGCCVFA